MNLGDADRVVITTFDASGTPTRSAEFVVALGEGRVGLWTPHAVGWDERLKLSQVVSVQAASSSGKPLRTEPVLEGRAELVSEGSEFEAGQKLTHDKYGFAAGLASFVDRAWELGGPRTPSGVVVVNIVG